MKTPKCAIYKCDEAVWAWQPWLDENRVDTFYTLGSHIRGFPVIKVGDEARQMIKDGREVRFHYGGVEYIAYAGKVERVGNIAKVEIIDGKRYLVPVKLSM